MKSPRIYTYKVTFEEIPHWYWGVHKEKKFGEFYLGSPKTNKWMWEFYTPKIQILEFFPYTDEGWKEANLVEDRLIIPDLNNLLCLNEGCNVFCSIEAARKGGKKGGKKGGQIKNAKMTPEQRSEWSRKAQENVTPEERAEYGRRAAAVTHAKKDELGRSVTAMKTNSQVWQSTVDGFTSTAGPVACHNKANGWDPAARVRIS
jgi:hypothetical protein